MFATSASEYIKFNSYNVPVNAEGIQYLISVINSMQLDYDNLVEEIRELEHTSKLKSIEIKSLKFGEDHFILDKDGH
jgi:hypothetical protein